MSVSFHKISKFLLYIAPFAVIVVTPSTLFPFIVGKYTFFKVVVESALVAFILGWGWMTDKSQISNLKSQISRPLVIAVTLFVAIFVLAGFTGVNPSASFWSNFERGEGSFLLLHFYAYFLLLTALFQNKDDWRRLFAVMITVGALVMLYGVMAALGVSGFVGPAGFCQRFAGSLGNPAYTGTFSIFMIFYAAYLLASGSWQRPAWRTWSLPVLVFLGVYFFVFLLFSQTRGALLGLGVGTIAAFVYLALASPSRKWRWVFIGVAAALVLSGLTGIYYRQYIDLAPWCEKGGGNRILDISFEGETINTRFTLWRQSIEAWKERPILGWGPENFSIAFEKYYNPVHLVWFDRAHNIFFDYLIFGGALGLLSFLGIFATYYWQFFKTLRDAKQSAEQRGNKKWSISNDGQWSNTAQKALLFTLPIAYLIQGLVLFDVLPIYINLFLFLAFAAYRFKSQNSNLKNTS